MNGKNKIISFDSLLANKEYQMNLAKKTNELMGNAESINTDAFLASDKFKSIFTVAEDVNMEMVSTSVKNIVGNDITKSELNLVLALMDANAEMVKLESDTEFQEKFVMDLKFDIGDKNGIFEVTDSEIQKLQNRSFYFQDKGKPVAEKTESGYVMKYEDGTVFLKLDKHFFPTKLPSILKLVDFFKNIDNKDD